jgi:acyl-CoA ligase (AMP-forming) (exosortase A-associated)
MESIFELLKGTVSRHGKKTALIDGRNTYTYEEFQELVGRMAAVLVEGNLPRFSRVAFLLDKNVEAAALIFATSLAGLIAVPINAKLKPEQVYHIIDDCDVAVFITTPYRFSQLNLGARNLRVILTGRITDEALRSGVDAMDQRLESSKSGKFYRCVENDPAAIMYTSGSTGMPKGVTVSRRNLVVGAQSVNAYLKTSENDVILALLPISFDAGLSQLTTGVAAGATIVLHNYTRAQEAVSVCEREGVTSITGVPPLWSQLSSVPWSEEARHKVSIIANTGGHMSEALLSRLRKIFVNARPFLMYGLTEAFRSTYLDPAQVDVRKGSIGKAIPNAEILVLNSEGKLCPPGEPGELVHRGPLVTLGYWNDAKRTAEKFRCLPHGPSLGLVPEIAVWSGDIVKTDAEGYLYFIGRNDEMLKSSGYRISPTEIEAVLYRHPDVRDAVVFGVPHPDLGSLVIAAVVPAKMPFDFGDLLDHCKRALPPYMVPALFEITDIPRSPNGKFDRGALRSLYERGAFTNALAG